MSFAILEEIAGYRLEWMMAVRSLAILGTVRLLQVSRQSAIFTWRMFIGLPMMGNGSEFRVPMACWFEVNTSYTSSSGIRARKDTEKMGKRDNHPRPEEVTIVIKGYQPQHSRPPHERKPPRGTSNYRPPPRDNSDKTK